MLIDKKDFLAYCKNKIFHILLKKKSLGKILTVAVLFLAAFSSQAATYNWIQSDWSGGADTAAVANHASNKTGWSKFYSNDSGIIASSTIGLSPITSTSTQTSDSDFNAGTKTNTSVSGSGSSAAMELSTQTTFTDLATRYVSTTTLTGNARRVAVSGNYAYVAATTGGVHVVDISDPAHPVKKSTIALANVQGVTINGSLLYVAAYTNGMKIYDVSSSTNPVLKSTYVTGNAAHEIKLVGNYAYIADRDAGFRIVDVSSSTNPTLVGSSPAITQVYGIDVVGNLVYVNKYVANVTGAVQVYDASNPASPTLLGNASCYGALYVVTKGSYAYCTFGGSNAGFSIYNFSSSTNPTLVRSIVTGGLNPGYANIVGNLLYIADGDQGIQVYDVSSSTNPLWMTNYGLNKSAGSTLGLTIAGNYLYSADDTGGLRIIDISSTPTNPQLQGSIAAVGAQAHKVRVVGNYAYMVTGAGLKTYDISNPTNPTLKSTLTYSLGGPGGGVDYYDIDVSGNYAYIAAMNRGLWIVNIASSTNPIQVASSSAPTIYDVAVVGNYAYVADRDAGLKIIDVSNPNIPVLKGTLATGGTAYGITVSGNYAYVSAGASGLKVIDISSSTNPTLTTTFVTAGTAIKTYISGTTAYIVEITAGLEIVDISNPASPVRKSAYNYLSYNGAGHSVGSDVVVSGNYAYLTNNFSLRVINISSSTAPTFAGAYQPSVYSAQPNSVGVDVSGRFVYLVDYAGGLSVLSVAGYASSGTFTSSVIDTVLNSEFGPALWNASTPAGTTLTIKARSSNSATMSGAANYSTCSALSNGQDLSASNCVTDKDRYVQYQASYTTGSSLYSPSLNDISFSYVSYPTSTSLVSSPFNAQNDANVVGDINWSASTSTGNDITFQIRTAPDSSGAPGTWSSWAGPTGVGSYYSDGLSSHTINASSSDGQNDQWMQYKVVFTTDGTAAPTLSQTNVTYVVNAPPAFGGKPTASQQAGTGLVNISYSALDPDTSITTKCANCIVPSFQYSTDGGVNWSDITAGLSAGATSPLTVNSSSATVANVTWDPRQQNVNTFSAQAQIRVKLNDREGANNETASTTASFSLDAKSPVLGSPAIVVIATTSPATLRLSATDDTAGLQMCITLDDTESNCQAYSANSTISLTTTPDTVYVHFKDAFGNVSTANAATPEKPSNMIVKDVSNVPTNDYQEFLVWRTVSLPFQRYDVWVSTGGAYSLLSSITDRATNYYFHKSLDSTKTYSYKVNTVDGNGNASTFSSIVSDQPNGLGGTNTVPPTISNVQISTTTTQSATITWNTDTLSDSKVNYSVGTNSFDSTTGSIVTMLDNNSSIGPHQVTLRNLTPGATYYFEVESTDVDGNTATDNNGGAGYSFATKSGAVITAVTASQINNTSATIVWNTDIPSNSYVVYSSSGNMADYHEVGTNNSVTSHAVTITGLTSGMTYYYYVRSGVATDNNSGQNYTLTTSNDTAAPTISGLTESIITDKAAVITWSTSEPANSLIVYSTTPGTYGTTVNSSVYDTSHSLTISGLSTSTTYYYRVTSADQSGNNVVSGEENFVTLGTLSDEAAVEAAKKVAAATEAASSSAALASVQAALTDAQSQLSNRSSGGGGGSPSALTLDQLIASLVSMAQQRGTAGEAALKKMFDAINQVSKKVSSNVLETSLTNLYGNLSGTVPPPSIFGDPKLDVSSDSVDISWKTDKPASSLVAIVPSAEYDPKKGDAAFSQVIGVPDEFTTSHTVTVDNLEPSTKYVLQVKSKTAVGGESKSDPLTFKTKNETPDINTYNVKNVAGDKATFSWVTTVETDSIVKYTPYRNGALAVDESTTKKDKAITKIHEVSVDNLEAGVKYNVELSGRDTKGQMVTKRIPSFSTSDDNLPPEISQVQTESALSPGKDSNVQTIISWTTNEPSNGMVYYQKGAGLANESAWEKTNLDPNYTRKHVVVITKFNAGAIYKFKIQSTDSGGHTATSKIYTVLSPKQTETVVDVIMKNTQDVFGWTKKLSR